MGRPQGRSYNHCSDAVVTPWTRFAQTPSARALPTSSAMSSSARLVLWWLGTATLLYSRILKHACCQREQLYSTADPWGFPQPQGSASGDSLSSQHLPLHRERAELHLLEAVPSTLLPSLHPPRHGTTPPLARSSSGTGPSMAVSTSSARYTRLRACPVISCSRPACSNCRTYRWAALKSTPKARST